MMIPSMGIEVFDHKNSFDLAMFKISTKLSPVKFFNLFKLCLGFRECPNILFGNEIKHSFPCYLVGRQFVPRENSSQATIRPKFRKATIRLKRQFVPSVISSHFKKATIRPICKKRQFVPNSLIDQLITNLLKVETREIIKPTTNEFIQPCENN